MNADSCSTVLYVIATFKEDAAKMLPYYLKGNLSNPGPYAGNKSARRMFSLFKITDRELIPQSESWRKFVLRAPALAELVAHRIVRLLNRDKLDTARKLWVETNRNK